MLRRDQRGEEDAVATAAEAGRLLGLRTEEVLVVSTGVIGVPLPLEKITAGLARAVPALSAAGGQDAAAAIMTTDTRPKQALVARDGFVIGGMAKGAGMIHPALATMLAVFTTDYPLAAGEVDAFLRPAVDASFNRISVDGECSTNDAVILLANGASGCARNDASFAAALHEVCSDLAAQIVADGEGATIILEIEVEGAATEEDATAIARRIATSPLVKTAAFGRDANWGRVLAAAGSAPSNGGFAELDSESVTLRFNGTPVFAAGVPTALEPTLEGTVCRIEPRPGPRRRLRFLPRLRPDLRLCPHQRGLPHVTPVVVKVGGAVVRVDADIVVGQVGGEVGSGADAEAQVGSAADGSLERGLKRRGYAGREDSGCR